MKNSRRTAREATHFSGVQKMQGRRPINKNWEPLGRLSNVSAAALNGLSSAEPDVEFDLDLADWNLTE